MAGVRPLIPRAIDAYLGSRVLRGAAVVLLAYLTWGSLFGFPGEDWIPYQLDYDVYREGGRAFLDGAELYAGELDVLIGETLPFTYPPIAAAIFSLFAMVPWRVGSVALSALSVAAMLVVAHLVVRELARSLGATRLTRADTGWLTVAAGCFMMALDPFAKTIDFGQINAILMALVLLDLFAGRGRWWQGSLIGLALAVKLTPAVFLGWFLMRGQWRQLAVGVGSAALVSAVGFLLAPRDSAVYWTNALWDFGRVWEPSYPPNQSLGGTLHRAGVGDNVVLWAGLCFVVGLGCLWLIHRLFRRGERLAPAVVLALYSLFASPVSWGHHFVWLGPALLFFATAAWRARSAGVARALGGFTVLGVAIFLTAPHFWFPAPAREPTRWDLLQHLVGGAYFWWTLAALVVVALTLREHLGWVTGATRR